MSRDSLLRLLADPPSLPVAAGLEQVTAALTDNGAAVVQAPPGSGKTMTLSSTLSAMPDCTLAFLNFSSSTTIQLLLQTFEQHCEYVTGRNVRALQQEQAEACC